MDWNTQKVNSFHLLFGTLLLLVGSIIYLVDRPPDQTYFISALPFQISAYDIYPPLFGHMAAFLPHFFHIIAFILLTAGIMGFQEKGNLAICAIWLAVHAGFELGQKYSAQAAKLVPNWFDNLFILENTRGYFLNGTYCWFDMAAIIIGTCCGYLILKFSRKDAITTNNQ